MDTTTLELGLGSSLVLLCLWLSRRTFTSLREISVFELAIFSNAVFFGIAPWVAWFYAQGNLPVEEPGLLQDTYLAIALYILGIWAAWRLVIAQEKTKSYQSRARSASLKNLLPDVRRIPLRLVFFTYVATLVIRAILALHYGILFSGTATEERVLSVPYQLVILSSIAASLSQGCLLWSSVALSVHESRKARALASTILLIEFVWAFLRGRRWLLNWLIFVALGSLVMGQRVRFKQIVLAVLGMAFLISVVFPYFIAVRNVYSEDASALDSLTAAVSVAYYAEDAAADRYADNMSTRPLIRRFITRVLDGQEAREPLMGDGLLSTIIWAIPSLVYADKVNTPQTEVLIQQYYGMRVFDTSISWAAVGVSDFGVSGGLVAGLCVGLYLFFFQKLILKTKRLNPFLTFILLGSLISIVLQAEIDPTAYWILLRDCMMLIILASSLISLLRPKAVPAITVRALSYAPRAKHGWSRQN